jgi:hypothetical protein
VTDGRYPDTRRIQESQQVVEIKKRTFVPPSQLGRPRYFHAPPDIFLKRTNFARLR